MHATVTGAVPSPPSESTVLMSATIDMGAGVMAAGTAAAQQGSVIAIGSHGISRCMAEPTHAPAKMSGKICPPTKPKPRAMPIEASFAKAVAMRVPALRWLPCLSRRLPSASNWRKDEMTTGESCARKGWKGGGGQGRGARASVERAAVECGGEGRRWSAAVQGGGAGRCCRAAAVQG
eukprot:942126-Prymnesium_polylepis.1